MVPSTPGTAAPPRRSCAFCGGVGPMTREHLWAAWMQELARHPSGRYRFGIAGVPASLTDFEAPAFTQTIRRVCATCNNGWMASLETQAKSLVTAMVAGAALLGAAEQTTISAWMYKTALVVGLLHNHEATKVDPGHYAELALGNMPPNTTIWLGRYDGTDMEAGAWLHRFEWENRQDDADRGDGYIFLVSALSLVAFGIVMGGTGDIPPGFEMGPRMITSFRRTWPPSAHYAVVWPTAPPISFAELEELMEAVRRRGGDATATNLVPGNVP